jgi:putative transposase
VLVSLCYVLLRWLLEFVALRARSKEFKDLEIIVLRHELAILRRTARRPAITAVDRETNKRTLLSCPDTLANFCAQPCIRRMLN